MKKSLPVLLVSLIGIGLVFSGEKTPLAPKRGSSSWGADDQRGAMNRLTQAKTLEAAQLIKQGKIYSLGRVDEEGIPVFPGRLFKLSIPHPDAPVGDNQVIVHDELIIANLGQVGTQLDGLDHVGIGDIFYNGHNRHDFATPHGLSKLGIENVGEPGIGMAAARFLVKKQIVLAGADTWGVEVLPTPQEGLAFPVHQILITQNGIHLFKNLDTSALAKDKIYEFAFFFAPLRIKGATGSPGNPVAVF